MAIIMTERWTDDPQVQDDPALGRFLRDLSIHADDTVDPATRAATLEAMLEVAAQAPSTSHPAPWARRARRVLGLTGVKLALAAGVAAATTTGGLAATGSLPAPIQSFAHDVGRHIGIGFPDAPGQQKKLTDEADTGRDFAPGQLRKSEPGTTGRDHAPGQQRDDGPPGQNLRTDDPDEPGRATPDPEPPAGVVPEQETPGDAAPETPGEPAQAPEQPEPPPPPDEDPPAGAANEPTPDPATAPGRPDAPAGEQPDSHQGPPDDASNRGTGR